MLQRQGMPLTLFIKEVKGFASINWTASSPKAYWYQRNCHSYSGQQTHTKKGETSQLNPRKKDQFFFSLFSLLKKMKSTSATKIVVHRAPPKRFLDRNPENDGHTLEQGTPPIKPKLRIKRRNDSAKQAATEALHSSDTSISTETLSEAKSSYSAAHGNDSDDENYDSSSSSSTWHRTLTGEDMRRLEESSTQVYAECPAVDAVRSKEMSYAIVHETLDCVACMCPVRVDDQIWQCSECFLIMHLVCLRRWAQSSAARPETLSEECFPDIVPTWKCPKCRKAYALSECPTESRCFCGKVVNPPVDLWKAPHSCGQVCGKPLQPPCGHTCLLLCHPGPCPPCPYEVDARCFCGKEVQRRRCADKKFSCGQVCGKLLSCGVHTCQQVCHEGPCDPCGVRVTRPCVCGKSVREVVCGTGKWHCSQPCGKPLACGRHTCEAVCHSGPCPPCKLRGERTCFCGKMNLGFLDCDVPTRSCGDMCGKVLPCGHRCPEVCHSGECPPCIVLVVKKNDNKSL